MGRLLALLRVGGNRADSVMLRLSGHKPSLTSKKTKSISPIVRTRES